MKFLTTKRIGVALRRWREDHKWSVTEIAERSKKLSQTPFATSTVANAEKHGRGFSFTRFFQDLLPAYGIQDIADFDLFLDYCLDPSLSHLVHLKASERDIHNFHGTKEILMSPDIMKGNRARISIIQLAPGKNTLWQNHEGHEYLLVSKGKIKAEFAEQADGQKTMIRMEKGDAVAFPSALYHAFSNAGTKVAEMIIARPTKSLPKGMYGGAKPTD